MAAGRYGENPVSRPLHGRAADDELSLEKNLPSLGSGVLDFVDEDLARLVTHLVAGLFHGGESRIGHQRNVDVVKTNNTHVLGHQKPQLVGSL